VKFKILFFAFLVFFVFSCKNKEVKNTAKKQKTEISQTKSIKKTEIQKGGEMVVEKNDTIEVEYTGKLDDGTVFDTSKGREPLKFKVGDGRLIPGFENGVIGMKENEEKTIHIKAKDAYGERNENFIKKFPRTMLPPDFKAEKGMMVTLQSQNGQQIPAKIIDIDKENITLDMNHPLAGENLTFDIKVIKIEKAEN